MALRFIRLATLFAVVSTLTGLTAAAIPYHDVAASNPATETLEPRDTLQHFITVPQDRESVEKNLTKIIESSGLLLLHKKLVEIESVSGHEEKVGRWLKSFLEAHNFSVTLQDITEHDSRRSDHVNADRQHRYNVYATADLNKFTRSKGRKASPKVLVTSHIDTVPPYIQYSLSVPKSESASFKREDVIISGRGTADAKNCVAAQITAVMDMLEDPNVDPADLALLFVVDEEVLGTGMRHFSDSALYKDTKAGYKAVIFGEPTEAKLAVGHKGMFMLELTAHGKAAHSGYPWLGESAISKILPALLALDKLGSLPESDGGFPRSERFGNTTVNVGIIDAGAAANVVPARAFSKTSFRLAAGDLETNINVVKQALKKVDPDGHLDYRIAKGYAPIFTDYDVEGLDTISVNYGTDVPNLKVDEGVKRYLYGGGSILVAHGDDEHITIGELEESMRGYKKLIRHALQL